MRSRLKIWAMHLTALRALMAAGTQWRSHLAAQNGGLVGRFIGLDYAGLKVALDMIGLKLNRHDWSRLQVLEQAAAAALNGEAG